MIRFNYVDRKLNGINKTILKELVKNIFAKENKSYKIINYIFCSDEYLLEINKSVLNHDYYTDIITFPLHETEKQVEAEIYISIDRVKENATIHNTLFKQELTRVIAHGALHLCGYKDKTQKDIKLMRGKEEFYINS
jgi:probable rRNA maturation factor